VVCDLYLSVYGALFVLFQHWFTGLPVVLKFMLSRFLFNQSTGRAEKIHERFLFDRVIFMDRYGLNVQIHYSFNLASIL